MSSIVLVVFIVLVVLVLFCDLTGVYRMKLLDNLARLAGLARLLVLDALADTFDQDHVLFREGARHLAGLALVDAGDNRNRVAFFNVDSVHIISFYIV